MNTSRRRAGNALLVLALIVIAAGLGLGVAALVHRGRRAKIARAVSVSQANLDRGLSQLSQTNVLNGRLEVSPSHRYDGQASAYAEYVGRGSNGYARGIYNVDWRPGQDVRYAAAFLLPPGFRAAMQGQVALMRWDDFPTGGAAATNSGGIVINGSDRRSYLEREGSDGRAPRVQEQLTGPFDLPEGRWFELEVRQHLGAGSATSEVLLDGRVIATSTRPNMFGRLVQRVRFGLVAIAAGAQRERLELWFARPLVSPAAVT